MKVIRQTSSELVLYHQPSFGQIIFAIILASIFMGLPFLAICMILFNVGVTTVSCQRIEPGEVNCKKQQSKLFGLVQQQFILLKQVKSAKFESKESIDSDGARPTSYQVTVATRTGDVRLIENYVNSSLDKTSPSEMQAIANRLNTFIQSNQSSLVIERDIRGDLNQSALPVATIGFFELIGGIIFLFFQSETFTFDKKSNRLAYKRRTLLGQTYQYHPLNSVKGTYIETDTNGDSDTHILRLLPETIYQRRVMLSSNLQKVQKIQDIIRSFLKIS
jgi:hypothetical protein